MYKVCVSIKSPGYKTVYLTGLFREMSDGSTPVSQMKEETLQGINDKFSKHYPGLSFKSEVTGFKKMKCDFIFAEHENEQQSQNAHIAICQNFTK